MSGLPRSLTSPGRSDVGFTVTDKKWWTLKMRGWCRRDCGPERSGNHAAGCGRRLGRGEPRGSCQPTSLHKNFLGDAEAMGLASIWLP